MFSENYKAYITRPQLDGETVDIFEAVDDKFGDEKIYNDVAKTKWNELMLNMVTARTRIFMIFYDVV